MIGILDWTDQTNVNSAAACGAPLRSLDAILRRYTRRYGANAKSFKALLALLLRSARAVGLACRAETFRVATYNVESYLDQSTADPPRQVSPTPKPKSARASCALKPDVLALQEMGSTNALLELRDSLKAGGLDLPYWEHVTGFDTNIHVAILSRFPFTARRPHTDDSFLLSGRRFRVSRGFGEVDIQVNTNYSFHAHRRPPQVQTRAVARPTKPRCAWKKPSLLREKIDARLAANPNANLVVLGDFNDTKDSASTRPSWAGQATSWLTRAPPSATATTPRATQPGNRATSPGRTITAKEDTYSRIDFILLSPGMAREWVTNETYVLTLPNWGVGSDHRPIVATFEAADK